ncbi:hypothetical protein HDU91_006565, partial [Kappamyces sp. JEL0680]
MNKDSAVSEPAASKTGTDPFFDQPQSLKDKLAALVEEAAKPEPETNEFAHLPGIFMLAVAKLKSTHETMGTKVENLAKIVDSFAIWEHFATGGLILTTAVVTWVITYFRLGMAWLLVLLWYLSFVYGINIKRLRSKIKAQIARHSMAAYVDSDTETVEWFNQLLARYWANMEIALSAQLKDTIDSILDPIKIAGLDELRLTKFRLGSQAPRIEAIKTFPSSGNDLLVGAVFTDQDISKKEQRLKELRNLEVVLQAKVAMVPLPVSLKELYFDGRLRVQLSFMPVHPHIKVIDLGFVSDPTIDFILKPLGADVNKLAGLGSLIRDIVKTQLASIIVNPVKLSLPIGEWFGESTGSTEVPIGVLRVVLYEAKGIKNVDVTGVSDPAALVYIGGNVVARTRTLDNTLDPKWNHVQHIIIFQSALHQTQDHSDELKFEVIHSNPLSTKTLGTTAALKLSKWINIMGISHFAGGESELTEKETKGLIHEWGSPFELNGVAWKPLFLDKKHHGSLRFDLSFYPILGPEAKPVAGIRMPGIVSVVVVQAKELPINSNSVVECVGTMNDLEVVRTPTRKRTANPTWNSTHNFYCSNFSRDNVKFVVINRGAPVGECVMNLQKASENVDGWYKLSNSTGKIRITVKFSPIDLDHSSIAAAKVRRFDPMGILRLNIIQAKELPLSTVDKASLGLAKSDPYCKVYLQGRTVGATPTLEKTQSPMWNDTFFTVSYSLQETITLDVYDYNNLSKDKRLCKADVSMEQIQSLAGGRSPISDSPDFEKFVEDGLKVVDIGQGKLDVWCPLYTKEEAKQDDLEELREPGKTRNFLNPIASSVAGMAASKKKQKGFIHFELEILPIDESLIVEYKDEPLEDPVAHPDPRLPLVQQPAPPVLLESDTGEKLSIVTKPTSSAKRSKTAREIIERNRSGILRVKIFSGTFERRVRPYAEIMANEETIYSTFTPLEASNSCDWFGASDQFVTDLYSTNIMIFIRDQQDVKQSTKDPVIGFWTGSFIDEVIGKNQLTLALREYSESWSNFAALPVSCSIEISSMYYPVLFGTIYSLCRLSDPYVVVTLNGKTNFKTKIHKKTLNPQFEEGTDMEIYSRIRSTVAFEVKDFNQFTSHATLGTASFSLASIKPDEVGVLELPLEGGTGSITIRYLFEEKALKMQNSPMLAHDARLETEQTSLGKFGKGILKIGTKMELGSMLGDNFKGLKKSSRSSLTGNDNTQMRLS